MDQVTEESEMKWFKHDSNAHNDAKIDKVLMKYGAEGYALYWYCIELIAGKVSSDNITFELEHDAEQIAYRLRIDSLRVEEIMRFMIGLGLFEENGSTITCMKLAKRLDERWTRSPDLKAVIRQSADGLKTVLSPLPLEEKRREEKRERGKTSRFVPPTVDEVREYCTERRNGISAEEFIAHYEANGWMRGKTKIKDWKACVRTWEQSRKDKPASSAFWEGGI